MSHDTNRPQFPGTRLRRLRSSAGIRDMVQETRLTVSDLIWPLVVVEGDKVEEPITSLPGVSRYSIGAYSYRTVEGYPFASRSMA